VINNKHMQTLNIFLGSSFHLMNYRKKLGEAARILNEKWLSKGVRVHLFKWEDFRSEYRGKSKQEEYIDEMVLKSEFCIRSLATGRLHLLCTVANHI
jgi:hypothetical protein